MTRHTILIVLLAILGYLKYGTELALTFTSAVVILVIAIAFGFLLWLSREWFE